MLYEGNSNVEDTAMHNCVKCAYLQSTFISYVEGTLQALLTEGTLAFKLEGLCHRAVRGTLHTIS